MIYSSMHRPCPLGALSPRVARTWSRVGRRMWSRVVLCVVARLGLRLVARGLAWALQAARMYLIAVTSTAIHRRPDFRLDIIRRTNMSSCPGVPARVCRV